MSTATIVAPATPPGEGGIAVFRLSGPRAYAVLTEVFVGKLPVSAMQPRHLYLGRLQDAGGNRVDEVLAVIMPAPHSYTGEDVVELHCHGGSQIRRTVLDVLLASGAQMAAPGEFTQRAFLNGRLDLAQAEAVIDVIRARSARASRVALNQLEGKLSQRIHGYAERLKTALALLEAHIDFPDDEVGALDLSELRATATTALAEMTALAASFDAGRVLREGLNLLILGRPNVGKSSLMNALLGESRAIVTEIPGTTRDTLEEQLVLGDLPIRLIDTAGVRESTDPVEQEGVRRARAKVDTADLILLLIDQSQSLTEEDRLAVALCDPARTLLVQNKADLPGQLNPDELETFASRVEVSAKRGTGLDSLVAMVTSRFLAADSAAETGEDVVVTERRHREALLLATQALERFVAATQLGTLPPECLAIELREALSALGQITGETTPDEILAQIFSRFCVGK